MPTYRLFVANLSDKVKATDLHAMFAAWGEVKNIEPFAGSKTSPPAGKVWLELETEHVLFDILEALNGYEVGELRLVVTPDKVMPRKQWQKLPGDQWDVCKQIAKTLGEKEQGPFSSILRIVRTCGPRFALVMLEEALAVEGAGGLWVSDGSRRRTPGGVFFYLIRQYASPPVSKLVLTGGEKPKEGQPPATGRPAEPAAVEPVPTSEPKPELVVPSDPLAEVRARLAALRQTRQAVQQDLEALQAGQKQGGLLTVMKQVLEVEHQIDALLSQYPDLS